MTTLVFQRGDHLRVHRGLYWHHGIYVSDDRVVEFGGGSLLSKARTAIRPVTLRKFVGSDRGEVVTHPQQFLFGLGVGLPDAISPDEIVHRAEWLADNCPADRYHLVGSNCEHVANWCVTGGYFESLQVRLAFGITGSIVGPGLLLAFRYVRALRRHPLLLAAVGTVMFIGPALYNTVPFAKWRDVLGRYPGYPPAEAARGDGQAL